MRFALMITAFVALAACGSEPDAAGPERRRAAGQVLGGEVTDDMLALDSVRSTSPPDPRAGAGPDSPSSDAEEGPTPSDAEPAASDPEAPALPAVEPTEAPQPE